MNDNIGCDSPMPPDGDNRASRSPTPRSPTSRPSSPQHSVGGDSSHADGNEAEDIGSDSEQSTTSSRGSTRSGGSRGKRGRGRGKGRGTTVSRRKKCGKNVDPTPLFEPITPPRKEKKMFHGRRKKINFQEMRQKILENEKAKNQSAENEESDSDTDAPPGDQDRARGLRAHAEIRPSSSSITEPSGPRQPPPSVLQARGISTDQLVTQSASTEQESATQVSGKDGVEQSEVPSREEEMPSDHEDVDVVGIQPETEDFVPSQNVPVS